MKMHTLIGVLGWAMTFSITVLGAQPAAESNASENPPADIWGHEVATRVSAIEISTRLLGDGWNVSPGVRIDDLEDIDKLPDNVKRVARGLFRQLRPVGVRSVADYTMLSKGNPLNSVTVRLFIFDDAEKCRAWWNKKYHYDGWEQHYKKVKSASSVCVDSLQTNKRAIAFGNVWLTTHQLGKGQEHITVADHVLGQLRDHEAGSTERSPNEQKQGIESANSGDGWHVYRGNAHSTGVAKSPLPDELKVLWEFKVPKGGFEGTPLIVHDPKDGKKTVYIGDMDGRVFALDLESGAKKWETKTSIGFTASPAYQDGRIFIGDIDGVFFCIDTDGTVQWKFETGGEITGGANFYNGHVLFGSQDSKLYLLNTANGEPIWEHETPDQIRCSTTIAGDRAFVAGGDGFFHVIDLKRGVEVGKADIHSPTGSTPAVLNNKVFFGTEQAEFFGVDWKTIKSLWAFAGDTGQMSVRGGAAVNANQVIFTARDRQVYSLNPDNGKLNWTVSLKAKSDASPVIAGDHVYLGATDGRFYALSLKNGKVIWEKQFNGGFLSSPAVAFGRLVIATDRGAVYCLGAEL